MTTQDIPLINGTGNASTVNAGIQAHWQAVVAYLNGLLASPVNGKLAWDIGQTVNELDSLLAGLARLGL